MADGPELAKAYIQLVPTTKGIAGTLKSEFSGHGKTSGDSFAKSFTSTIKKAIAAAGIGKIVASAFKQGAELEQNLGGTEAVFGDFASEIQKTAKNAYKNMGTSASDYMATANKMASLFQGSGIEQREALELTEKAMQRAADVASIMGIDTSAALESVTGAAKGNFTRNLVNKNRVNASQAGIAA